MRTVLFLDIDGVLNSHWHVLRTYGYPLPKGPKEDKPLHDFILSEIDPVLVWNLEFIAKVVPDLEIVISSSWRTKVSQEMFQDLFTNRLKLKGIKIIGATPTIASGQKFSERPPRIAHIEEYRRENGLEWKECVIVDDHALAPNTDYDDERYSSRWLPQDRTWEERVVQVDQRDGLTYSRTLDVIAKFVGWDGFRPPTTFELGF